MQEIQERLVSAHHEAMVHRERYTLLSKRYQILETCTVLSVLGNLFLLMLLLSR